MYSVYKLNKQGDNIVLMYSFSYWEPCCLEPCLESVVPCPVLTVASWPAYRFLKRQIRCPSLSGFSTVYCDPHKGFGIVNKAKVGVFLENSCFFDDPTDVGNLISGSSAFSKSSLNIWKFMVHVLLKPGLGNFVLYFASMWDECNCAVVWTFFGIAFLCNWNGTWPFPVLWPLLFSKFAGILSAALSQHHLLGFEIAPCTNVFITFISPRIP